MKWENGACATSIAKIRSGISVVGFGLRLYVAKNAEVDGVDDVIGPELPVAFGPESVTIPRLK
jgi:hypothetical protein